jgi:hypothetical protein
LLAPVEKPLPAHYAVNSSSRHRIQEWCTKIRALKTLQIFCA